MEKYRRFFKVTDGPLLEEIDKIEKVNNEAHVEYKKILAEIGANEKYYQIDNKLVALVFNTKPDTNLYKKAYSGWYPKKNSKKSKELNQRLSAIKTIPQNKALEVIGLHSQPTIFSDGKCWSPTILVIPSTPKVCFVAVPWYDENPEKIEKYKKDKEEGLRYAANMEAILWEPTPDMLEIKEWQYLKEIDEWNVSVRARKAAHRTIRNHAVDLAACVN